jgi:hypothetical protein
MSKHYETNSMYPFSSRAFQRYQEHHERHYRLRDLKVANKTNKLPSLIDTIELGLGSTLIILFSKMLIIFKKNILLSIYKKFVEGKYRI